ncbi:MAG TPA: SDR family oxidoreductase [Candidatus Polarisedimenticolia bacterium]|nr:SDR family oxidoreductase [Candidatus Polarisedimenticolia bacterium]
MPRFLVTGGAGFIGSSLVRELVARGEQVRVLDNFATGRRDNLRSLAGRIEVVEGRVEEPGTVATAMQGIDYVLHQAALPSVQRSVEAPVESHAANLTGTLVLLQAAAAAGARRFVYASSSSVYGDSPTLPKVETMPTDPLSPYAVGKLGGELYCRVFHRLHGLETVSLRYFNVFGPGQSPDSQYAAVVPRFIAALKAGHPPVVFGDGLQSRDFTYIDNVVQANLSACSAGKEAAGEAFNIATGQAVTLLDLLNRMKELLGSSVDPRFEPGRKGDVRASLADVRKAERLLGYRPRISLDEGLKRTLESFATSSPA